MITVTDFDFKDKKVLIRVDFNVPLNDKFEVTDDTRIEGALPTIQKIVNDGGAVILMSHLGRPKGGWEERFSLKHIVGRLSAMLHKKIVFAEDCIGEPAQKAARELKPGEILLLENLRFHPEEQSGDKEFAKELASLGGFYVNDAFGTAHRAHASTAIIAEFFKGRKAFGLLMSKEIENLQTVLGDYKKPFSAVIGGAKVSSKISIIQNLLSKIDNLIIGGGMAYTFTKAQGGKVGNSIVEAGFIREAKNILKKADEQGVRVMLPKDTVAGRAFSNDTERKTFPTDQIEDGWMGLDIGPEAIKQYTLCLQESGTILWNGPMGVFEFPNFAEGTKQVAYGIVTGTERGAYSLIGGGDSVAAINQLHLKDHVGYVSTGGGAMLEYIEGKTLPGVAAIQES